MTPDFDALRAERNRKHAEAMERLKADGWNVSGCMHNQADACYCTCGISGEGGGLCEHKWDGKPYESEDKTMWSTTCSRCGITSYSHSMRVGP